MIGLIQIYYLFIYFLKYCRHHEGTISSRQLAEYTLALVALCKDPRRFHGHDLVSVLLHREPAHAQELALASLAACSAGARARRRHIRRLLDAASTPADHNLGSYYKTSIFLYNFF